MNYSARNLQLLYARQPDLQDKKLEDVQPLQGFELRRTPSGLLTATLQGCYLHSRYDPTREARRIVETEAGTDTTAAVLFGFGLGYLAEAFVERHPGKPLVVVEKQRSLFAQALASRDLGKLLSLANVFWYIDEQPEAIMMGIDSLPLGRLCVLKLRSLLGSETPYYSQVEVLLRSLFDKREVNINTLDRFGKLWIRNLLANLELFTDVPGINLGRERFAGIPALVLAAGPSLDAVLPHLEGLRRRMLVVAVDTSFRPCLQQGLQPDFLVTVDPQYWNSRHLDRLSLGAAILVSESSAHPRVFRLLNRSKDCAFFVSSFFPLGRYLEGIIGEKGPIGAGGSVATTAWDLSRYLGSRPIYLAGLDLGFPGRRTHAGGAFFEETMHTLSCRLEPVEQMSFSYLYHAGPSPLPNYEGGTTLSDRRMLIYKWWFENQMKQQERAGGPATCNLSGEAVRIEGMPFADIQRLFELPVVRKQIDRALKDLKRQASKIRSGPERRKRLLAVKEGLDSLAAELKLLETLAHRGAELCSPAVSSPTDAASARKKESRDVLSELAKVDRDILELSSRQIAGFLFQPLVRRILDHPEGPADYAEALANSRTLYRELEASASYHLRLLSVTGRRP